MIYLSQENSRECYSMLCIKLYISQRLQTPSRGGGLLSGALPPGGEFNLSKKKPIDMGTRQGELGFLNHLTRTGIEPATFGFVCSQINQLRHGSILNTTAYHVHRFSFKCRSKPCYITTRVVT